MIMRFIDEVLTPLFVISLGILTLIMFANLVRLMCKL